MTVKSLIATFTQQEDLNFLLTNRIPRAALTRFMGWFSRIEQPVVRDLSIALFGLFAGDLRLHETKHARFASLHDCFVRELKDGARPLDPDPDVLVSPCDGIVGAFGAIDGTELLQAKGSAYSLEELLGVRHAAERFRGGMYVTLRLTASMYHRFHAPAVVLLCRRVVLQPHDVSGVHSGPEPGAFPPVSSECVLVPGCPRERHGRQLQNGGLKPSRWPTRSASA